jgi:hypothetical protein
MSDELPELPRREAMRDPAPSSTGETDPSMMLRVLDGLDRWNTDAGR